MTTNHEWKERAGAVRFVWAAAGLVSLLALAIAPSVLAKECKRSRPSHVSAPSCADLPPGHPPVDCTGLPPGHPPVTLVPGLPPGHPPVVMSPGLPADRPPLGSEPALPPGHPQLHGSPETPPGHPLIDDRPLSAPLFDQDAPQTL